MYLYVFKMLDKESQRIVIRHKRDSEKSFDEYLEKAINGEVSMAKIISTLEKIKKLSDYIDGKFNV